KDYAEAGRSFVAARQSRPGDPDVAAALAELDRGQAADEAAKRRLAEYQAHFDAGKAAVAARRYQEAIQAFTAAQRVNRTEEAARAYGAAATLSPDDPTATRMAKQLDQLLEGMKTNQAAYVRFLSRGGLALRAGLYVDAMRAYTEVLRIVPNDPEALLGLR